MRKGSRKRQMLSFARRSISWSRIVCSEKSRHRSSNVRNRYWKRRWKKNWPEVSCQQWRRTSWAGKKTRCSRINSNRSWSRTFVMKRRSISGSEGSVSSNRIRRSSSKIAILSRIFAASQLRGPNRWRLTWSKRRPIESLTRWERPSSGWGPYRIRITMRRSRRWSCNWRSS